MVARVPVVDFEGLVSFAHLSEYVLNIYVVDLSAILACSVCFCLPENITLILLWKWRSADPTPTSV